MSAALGRQPGPLRLDPDNCTSAAAEIGVRMDEAIALFRRAMPGCGLKLVVPPPLPDGSAGRLALSTWRRGEQSVPVHFGGDAQEAIQRTFDSEHRAQRERRRRTSCPHCRGIGWYIAVGGVRAMCTHAPASP